MQTSGFDVPAESRRIVTRWIVGAIVLTSLLVGACAPARPDRQRFFWPPGAQQPRIEYINFYEKSEDAKRGQDRWLAEAILGKEKPQALFDKPADVASTGHGRFYVSDAGAAAVYVFDLTTYETRFLLDPKGRRFPFKMPQGLALDGAGRVYVSDLAERQIFIFGPDDKLIAAVGAGILKCPAGIAVAPDGSRIYAVETQDHRIAVLDGAGKLVGHFGRRGSGPGGFNYPLDIDLDGAGNLYVVDSLNARVQVFDPQGRFLRQFGERGTALGSFQIPKALGIDAAGHVYVTDARAHRFVIFDLAGNYLLTIGAKHSAAQGVAPGGFLLPGGIDADDSDGIYVVDILNRMVHRFQYLNEAWLAQHPIEPGEAAVPVR